MNHQCVCGNDIPQGRYELGYRICVTCSTEPMWSGIPITYHKTGNTIQVVKDPAVAEEFFAKTRRSGFGAMKGMTTTVSIRKAVENRRERKERKVDPPSAPSYVIGRRKVDESNYADEEVATETIRRMEKEGPDSALAFLDMQFKSMRVSPVTRKQLQYIINNWEI